MYKQGYFILIPDESVVKHYFDLLQEVQVGRRQTFKAVREEFKDADSQVCMLRFRSTPAY